MAIKISEMASAATLNDSDMLELSQADQSETSGYASRKTTIVAVGNRVNTQQTYPSDLQTTNKTIVGAINEIAQGGGGGGVTPEEVAEIIAELKTPTDAEITGGVASFPTIEENYVKALKVAITPIQSGSGTPSPTNIRPISGHTQEVVENLHGEDTETVTIPFNQTVYGGSLDVTSGVLTIDKVLANLGDLTWSYNTSRTYPVFLANIADKNDGISGEVNILCSDFQTLNTRGIDAFANNDNDGCICERTGYKQIMVQDSRYTDATSFKTAMDGVQLCYELSTPQTIQLTPTQIKAFTGENNISASTGDVGECKYTQMITIEDIRAIIDGVVNTEY